MGPPCLLADTKGGTYYAAVDASVDGFRFEDVFNTARQGTVVAQTLTGDLSLCNARCFDGFKARARAFNAEAEATGCTGRVLRITGLSSSHIITRGVVIAFRYDKLIPRLFDLTW